MDKFELTSPKGTVGEFELPGFEIIEMPNWLTVVLTGVLLAAYTTLIYFISTNSEAPWKQGTITFIALVVYHFLGYWIRPVPDYSNLGYLGGAINNPFRISDNFNRTLVGLRFLLLPGQAAVSVFATFFHLFKGKKSPTR